jgi:hydrogenase-4 component J
MTPRVRFYQLSSKFVNQSEDIPEDARQVMYYTLAIGHHVGVLDCFTRLAEAPLEEYQAWVEALPPGEGRAKLEGVIRWGEIEINRSHVALLLPLLETPASCQASWAPVLLQCLQGMVQEPALYLMVRKVS